jgi:hypothetical protein
LHSLRGDETSRCPTSFFQAHSREVVRHIAFRHYLRAHPEAAMAYEKDKRCARDLHPNNSYSPRRCLVPPAAPRVTQSAADTRRGEKQSFQMRADRGRLSLRFGQRRGAIGEMSIPEIKSL